MQVLVEDQVFGAYAPAHLQGSGVQGRKVPIKLICAVAVATAREPGATHRIAELSLQTKCTETQLDKAAQDTPKPRSMWRGLLDAE